MFYVYIIMKQKTKIIQIIFVFILFSGFFYYCAEVKNVSIGWSLTYSTIMLIILSLFGIDASGCDCGCQDDGNEDGD